VGIVFLGLLSIVTIISAYLFVRNPAIVWLCLLFILLVFSCAALFVVFLRRKLVLFSDNLCQTIDDMLNGAEPPQQMHEEENLFYKINYRLAHLYDVLRESQENIAKERADLQELISDISHQVKTPISNLKMVNATLLEQPMPEEKRREFLQASSGQLEKLDFLMQAMIKTSRLETGVISLDRKIQPLYDTLAAALGGILLNAERKHIHVGVDCPEDIILPHDRKWTSEALFNILENAVKYTPAGGTIRVSVQSWEFYVKIDITDSGKGIAENRQGIIFKRFYREEEVHDIEGIGIGLYLAREIITMQGGYIKVTSTVGCGSTFSVFLPHR
jgi:signal transduction histidine kinase